MSAARRHALRLGAVFAGAALLPGCANRGPQRDGAARIGRDPLLDTGPQAVPRFLMGGALRPAAPPQAATEVFFATNRAPDGEGSFADAADPARHARLLVGATLAGTAEDTETIRPILAAPRLRGTDDFAGPAKAEDSAAGALQDYLELAAARDAMPLLFVHGFQCGFDYTLARAAQIAEFYAAARPRPLRLAPLAFCWPSSDEGGGPSRYRAERQAAAASGVALARLLRALEDSPPSLRRPLRLIAHSSGAWVLQHALQALRQDGGRIPEGLFRAAVIAAGDVGADALTREDALGLLPAMAETVTIAVNPNDAILSVLSQRLMGNGPRLGLDGAPQAARLPGGTVVVNFKDRVRMPGLPWDDDPVPGDGVAWNTLQHQYYRNAPGVRDDLAFALLGQVEAPGRRRYVPGEAADPAMRTEPFYFYAT
jgi:esterase/lipase superfamily enzyme